MAAKNRLTKIIPRQVKRMAMIFPTMAAKACAGVCFTLEPESGFRDVTHLSGVWGLGENIVQGTVLPDEFFVFKPALLSFNPDALLKGIENIKKAEGRLRH